MREERGTDLVQFIRPLLHVGPLAFFSSSSHPSYTPSTPSQLAVVAPLSPRRWKEIPLPLLLGPGLP